MKRLLTFSMIILLVIIIIPDVKADDAESKEYYLAKTITQSDLSTSEFTEYYNEYGDVIKDYYISNDQSGIYEELNIYKYEAPGVLIEKHDVLNDTSTAYQASFIDENTLESVYTVYNDEGSPVTLKDVITFNSEGKKTEETRSRMMDGEFQTFYKYSYDAFGNLTEQTFYSLYYEGEWSKKIYENEYYDDHLIKSLYFYADNYQPDPVISGQYLYDYEFDKNGNVSVRNKYHYNSEDLMGNGNRSDYLVDTVFYTYLKHGEFLNEDGIEGYPPENGKSFLVTSGEEFSEGLAWISFEDIVGNVYSGVVDTEGKVKYYYEKEFEIPEPFYNGMSYCRTSNQKGAPLYLIDAEGTVINSYSSSDDYEEVRAWGDGYVVEQKYTHGFDEAKYEYLIKDSQERVLDTFEVEGTDPIKIIGDVGEGVFCYLQGGANFYFTKSGTWIMHQKENMVQNSFTDSFIEFRDGILLYFCGTDNNEVFFSYLDLDGNQMDIVIPEEYGDDPVVKGVSDGVILFFSYNSKCYFTYNTKTNNFSRFEGKYADRIYHIDDRTNTDPSKHYCAIGNGVIALPFEGIDGEAYIGLIDAVSMEMIVEPFYVSNSLYWPEIKIRDGVLSVQTSIDKRSIDLYDLSGNKLYTFNGWSHELNGFSDNIMVLTANDSVEYLHYNGTRVFPRFDFSEAKCISL